MQAGDILHPKRPGVGGDFPSQARPPLSPGGRGGGDVRGWPPARAVEIVALSAARCRGKPAVLHPSRSPGRFKWLLTVTTLQLGV